MTFDAERYVRDTFRALRFAAGAHPMPYSLAERAMGEAPFARGRRAEAVSTGGHWQIIVPRGLTRAAEHWTFTRELAGWLLQRDGIALVPGRRCAVAEALVLPEYAVSRVEPVTLAERLTLPVIATAYRAAVVSGKEAAIVARRWSRRTGTPSRLPRDPAALAACAFGGVTPLRVRRVVADGEPEVVLVAA